jgi:hypothetical protein
VIKSATLTLTLTLTQTIHGGTLRTLPTTKLRDLQDFPVLGDTRRHPQIGIVAPKVARVYHWICCRTVAVAHPDTTENAIRCNTQQPAAEKPL